MKKNQRITSIFYKNKLIKSSIITLLYITILYKVIKKEKKTIDFWESLLTMKLSARLTLLSSIHTDHEYTQSDECRGQQLRNKQKSSTSGSIDSRP